MKEEVRQFLDDKRDALDVDSIMSGMGLEESKKDELVQVLDELENTDFEVFQTRKHKFILYKNSNNLIKGYINVNKNGKGFLKTGVEGESDIAIYPSELRYALDGDLVVAERVEYTSNNDKRVRSKKAEEVTGRVIKILKRDVSNIVGEIVKNEEGELEFKSLDKRDITFVLDESEFDKVVEGNIVVLDVLSEINKNKYTAVIKKKLGHKDDAGMDIKIICAKHDVYDEFPEEVEQQLEEIPTEVSDADRVGRVDLTDKMIFTIDGKDTKDIDDAISLEMDKDGNYVLGVHIADVSYYVTENSPLDKEALKRGTSCYPPSSVIPMLPHKLSNGICSLNEDVDRCALSCEMTITPQGRVVNASIFPSVIHSRKKMNYDDVNTILNMSEDDVNEIIESVGKDKLDKTLNLNMSEEDIAEKAEIDNRPELEKLPKGYAPFAQNLKLMQELAHILREERTQRGASDFDIKEAKVICDETGRAIDVVSRDRGEGERLIEDFMIAANEAVARAFYYNHAYGVQLPGVYRVHETPLPTKIEDFISFLGSMGHEIKGSYKKINFKTMRSILEQIEYANATEEEIIKSMAVRSMPKAFYSSDNLGHYGLASKCYTHFTSPIRRYPDLQTHRLIREFFVNGRTDHKTIIYYENLLPEVCRQASEREVKAAEAERECVKMKMAEYMEDFVGQEFDAVVKGITPFGMFVELPNLVEGLVHVKNLDGYYAYDEKKQTLSGEGGDKFTLGKALRVKCTGASKETMDIDFEIIKTKNLNDNQDAKKLEKKKHGRSK